MADVEQKHVSDAGGATSEACLAALRAAFAGPAMLEGAEVPVRNCADHSYLPPAAPLAVLRPDSSEGVARVLAICAEHGIAVVPQGGLTGLVGGARPVEGGIALSLERFAGIEEIDVAAATMTVRAGTPLEVIQKAAAAEGFFFALDLGARGSCQIGGNLGTNAGGNRVIRYGMARELVLGLEVALPDGTLMTALNKMMKNNAGYDLKQLFIGSEGTLGVITRVVLRLHPEPGCTVAAMCGVTRYEDVVALLGAARRGLGPMLSAFEVMWPDYWHVATVEAGRGRPPLEGAHGFYVLIEMQGMEEAVDGARFERWIEAQFEAGLVADAALSRSLADIAAFWATRDAAAELTQILGRHASFDIGLPVARMDDFARACRARLAEEVGELVSLYYGHIGDGNMHIVAALPGAATQPMAEIARAVYDTVREFGGTVSAEHGIGTVKKPYLPYTRGPAELALMALLKSALDPWGILNPGKVVDLPAPQTQRQ